MRPSVAGLLLLLSLACAGLAAPPGRGHGDARFAATLHGEYPSAAADGPVFAQRLEDLGVTVSVVELADDSLRLDVAEALGPEVLQWILPRYALEITCPHGTLRNEDVESATAGEDELTRRPIVEVVLTEAGGTKFCEMSRASVGQQIDIRVDGVVMSAPVVREAICGGRLQISMGDGTLDEATSLAVGLGSPALSSSWTVQTLE